MNRTIKEIGSTIYTETLRRKKFIQSICNPFDKTQSQFVQKILENPFLDMRYLNNAFVTISKPYIFACLSFRQPRIEFIYNNSIHSVGIESIKTIGIVFLTKAIKNKDERTLRDIVMREILVTK